MLYAAHPLRRLGHRTQCGVEMCDGMVVRSTWNTPGADGRTAHVTVLAGVRRDFRDSVEIITLCGRCRRRRSGRDELPERGRHWDERANAQRSVNRTLSGRTMHSEPATDQVSVTPRSNSEAMFVYCLYDHRPVLFHGEHPCMVPSTRDQQAVRAAKRPFAVMSTST